MLTCGCCPKLILRITLLSFSQVLVLPKTVPLNGADLQLLSAEGFQAHSAAALRTLMHAGPAVQPLLHHYRRLKQVRLLSVDCSEKGGWKRRLGAAAFDSTCRCAKSNSSLIEHQVLFAFLQVAIFVPEDPEQPTRSIDAAAFQQLPKLNCLTVAGERDGAGLLLADAIIHHSSIIHQYVMVFRDDGIPAATQDCFPIAVHIYVS